MLPYTEAEKALIQSNMMVGSSRPLADVFIAGEPRGRLVDGSIWSTRRQIIGYGYGNMAQTADGRAIACYIRSGNVCVAFAETVKGVVEGTADFGGELIVKEGVSNAQSSINLIDGVLYLAVSFTDTVLRAELWADETGLGTGFAKKSDISTKLHDKDIEFTRGALLSAVFKLGNGNLCVLTPWREPLGDGQQAHYSSDNGATWTAGSKFHHSGITVHFNSASGSVLPISDSSFISSYSSTVMSSIEGWLVVWTNSGANLAFADWQGWGTTVQNESFFIAGDTAYLRVGGDTYQYISDAPLSAETVGRFENWALVNTIPSASYHNRTIPCGTYIVTTFLTSSRLYVTGSESYPEMRLPVKSIHVDPIKNGAGQCSVVIDNANGKYAPDSTNEWGGVIWPNKEISIKLGYGKDREKVFTGLIDTIDIRTFPQEITIQARDILKRALDQTVTDDEGYRSLEYEDKSPEYIFTDLAVRAGFNLSKIRTDDGSGLTMSITFTHETYADAMTKLAQMLNYEYYAGREGELYFHYATDRQPESIDEEFMLSGTVLYDLKYYPIVTNSIKVYSNIGKTGTLYELGVDYEIISGGKDTPWKISRIEGGSITSGSTVYVSYVYAAWVFEEGHDIFSLGYTIDDADIYASATVLGRTEQDTVCHGSAEYGSKDYYNVLPQKVLITEDQSATTPERCEYIAEQLVKSFNPKPRRVEFMAVGNPYLWVGDCIMVIESSSTISEIYRIESIKHSFTADGAPVYSTSITAYHYGYSPI